MWDTMWDTCVSMGLTRSPQDILFTIATAQTWRWMCVQTLNIAKVCSKCHSWSVCSNTISNTWTPLLDRFIDEHPVEGNVPSLRSVATSPDRRHQSGRLRYTRSSFLGSSFFLFFLTYFLHHSLSLRCKLRPVDHEGLIPDIEVLTHALPHVRTMFCRAPVGKYRPIAKHRKLKEETEGRYYRTGSHVL